MSTNGNYMFNNYLTNVSLKMVNVNNDYVLIVPNSRTDQETIEGLSEGFYFLFVTGTNNGKTF